MKLFICDQEKNTECSKRGCFYNKNIPEWARVCSMTIMEKYAKIGEDGMPVVAYETKLTVAGDEGEET